MGCLLTSGSGLRAACTYLYSAPTPRTARHTSVGRLDRARNAPRNNGVIVIVPSTRHRFYISLFRGGRGEILKKSWENPKNNNTILNDSIIHTANKIIIGTYIELCSVRRPCVLLISILPLQSRRIDGYNTRRTW